MTVRRFRWVFLDLLGLIFGLTGYFSERPAFAASIEWTNGSYAFSGGTQPWSLGLSAVIVVAFILLMRAKRVESAGPLPGLLIRFAAFWIDFLLALFAFAPLYGAVPVIVEWRRTGAFAWFVERNIRVASDVPVVLLSMALLMVGLLFHFTIPFVLRRPSPGACVAGYQVVADEGYSLSLERVLLRNFVGYFALCTAWIAPFAGRDKQAGKFWLDKLFHTRAVLLD
ncbi:RDD family protein [uncultured Paludibaculum sp.]|uniref:RDD family protein n=1 Tax=uncultured Paludibaculum sp. TaxID=1765020 RepID=UPI002AAB2931|nr:RDD family protein [uncultured Paludibaculum sp.]